MTLYGSFAIGLSPSIVRNRQKMSPKRKDLSSLGCTGGYVNTSWRKKATLTDLAYYVVVFRRSPFLTLARISALPLLPPIKLSRQGAPEGANEAGGGISCLLPVYFLLL